jgi:hypothetical protein
MIPYLFMLNLYATINPYSIINMNMDDYITNNTFNTLIDIGFDTPTRNRAANRRRFFEQ